MQAVTMGEGMGMLVKKEQGEVEHHLPILSLWGSVPFLVSADNRDCPFIDQPSACHGFISPGHNLYGTEVAA